VKKGSVLIPDGILGHLPVGTSLWRRLMTDNSSFRNVKRSELVNVALSMIDGKLSLIEGARRICSLRYDIGDPENEVFLPILGFESETDNFPLGNVRDAYAAEYLQRLDEEADYYITETKDVVIDACREIVRTFLRTGKD
jgi:hypothetical protein